LRINQNALYIILGPATVALAGIVMLQVTGSVTVCDRTNATSAAWIESVEGMHNLRPLPGNIYIGIPKYDGLVKVRCRNGSITPLAYATAGLHSWVTPELACATKP
jgi:hypothetical protein